MQFLAKLFRRQTDLGSYVVRLAMRGPTGDTRYQFLRFQAPSLATAVEHARRRGQHASVLRWKLLDGKGKTLCSGLGGVHQREEQLVRSTG